MIGMSGLIFPIRFLSPGWQVVAKLLPMTYAVSLLRGIVTGDSWAAHTIDLAALAVTFVVSIALSTVFFRWE
jgi:ABC-type polysaccharide/polyol phosphate export permease